MEVDAATTAGLGAFFFVWLIMMIVFIAANWIIYKKAGKPGWAVLIPIYNLIVFLEIIKKPIWWIILMFIPFVNFIIAIIMLHRLSLSFGKGIGFTIGLILFPPIFILILAFGSAQYRPLPE